MEQSRRGPGRKNLMALGSEHTMSTARLVNNHQEKGKYSYAAQPLRERPPEKNAPRQIIKPGKNGNAGGRKTAHRFKIGIEVIQTDSNNERQSSNRRGEKPAESAHQHGPGCIEHIRLELVPENQPKRKRDQGRNHKSSSGNPAVTHLSPVDENDYQRK